jgi:hypothetical protein
VNDINGRTCIVIKLLLFFQKTIATMARRPPIKRSDHKKNKGKKPDQEDNQPQKKDDDTDTSTEPSTVISKEDCFIPLVLARNDNTY